MGPQNTPITQKQNSDPFPSASFCVICVVTDNVPALCHA
jgi:hypothetical protein